MSALADLFTRSIAGEISFSPYANIITMVFCVAIFIAMKTLPEQQSREHRYIILSCLFIFLAGIAGCAYFYIILPFRKIFSINAIVFMHDCYYLCMMMTLLLYMYFVCEAVSADMERIYLPTALIHVGWMMAVMLSQMTHIGFWVDQSKNIHENYFIDVYTFCFIYYVFVSEWIIMSSKHILYSKIKINMAFTFTLLAVVNILQCSLTTDTFVNPSLLIPLIYFMTVFRQNSFDKKTNMMNEESFVSDISHRIEAHGRFYIGLLDVDGLPFVTGNKEGNRDFRQFCRDIDYHGMIYRLGRNRLGIILKNTETDLITQSLQRLYLKYNENYKGIIVPNLKEMNTGDELLFIATAFLNDVRDKEIKEIAYSETIKKDIEARLLARRVLADIARKKDLEDGRVRVFCQPIFDNRTKRIASAEALMRIYVPDYGFLFPQTFIPIAEHYGYIHILSMIILDHVCQYIEEGEWDGMVTVNFSTTEFLKDDFIPDVTGIVKKYDISPEKIGIEITESRMEKDFAKLKATVQKMRDLGFSILIDDFGTGYSNLNRIFSLPVSVVKFDRSLLISSESDGREEIMKELSSLFRHLGIKTLCEGIEEQKDEKFCSDMKIDYFQGYLYSRPIPIENLVKISKKIDDRYNDRTTGSEEQ